MSTEQIYWPRGLHTRFNDIEQMYCRHSSWLSVQIISTDIIRERTSETAAAAAAAAAENIHTPGEPNSIAFNTGNINVCTQDYSRNVLCALETAAAVEENINTPINSEPISLFKCSSNVSRCIN